MVSEPLFYIALGLFCLSGLYFFQSSFWLIFTYKYASDAQRSLHDLISPYGISVINEHGYIPFVVF